MIDLGHLSLLFVSGCVGGLANSMAVWLLGMAGITKVMGVQIAPSLTPKWLYPRIVWGGLWGFIFLFPFSENSLFLRGILGGLGPTLVVLFWVFPKQAHKGMLGLQLGKLTPLFALIVNAVWGVTTVYWLQMIS